MFSLGFFYLNSNKFRFSYSFLRRMKRYCGLSFFLLFIQLLSPLRLKMRWCPFPWVNMFFHKDLLDLSRMKKMKNVHVWKREPVIYCLGIHWRAISAAPGFKELSQSGFLVQIKMAWCDFYVLPGKLKAKHILWKEMQ